MVSELNSPSLFSCCNFFVSLHYSLEFALLYFPPTPLPPVILDLLEGRETISFLFTLLKVPSRIHCTDLKQNRILLSLIGFIISLEASVDEEYFVIFLELSNIVLSLQKGKWMFLLLLLLLFHLTSSNESILYSIIS